MAKLPLKTKKPQRPYTDAKGRFLPGNPGRPMGAVCFDARDAKAFAHNLLMAPDPQVYLLNLRDRILAGEAPHMEKFFAEHLWGKPKEVFEVSGSVSLEIVLVEKLLDARRRAHESDQLSA